VLSGRRAHGCASSRALPHHAPRPRPAGTQTLAAAPPLRAEMTVPARRTSAGEGCENCSGPSLPHWIWRGPEVIRFVDDTNFNISSVHHLHWHKKSRRWYFYNDKHLYKQLLKGANNFGS